MTSSVACRRLHPARLAEAVRCGQPVASRSPSARQRLASRMPRAPTAFQPRCSLMPAACGLLLEHTSTAKPLELVWGTARLPLNLFGWGLELWICVLV